MRWLAALLATALVAATPAPAAAQPDGLWWHDLWRMPEVWQITDGAGVTVAVVDTGVQDGLPDLAGAVLPGVNFLDPDRDGRVDYDDEFSHGTAVASLIAGNGTSVRGVAPGAAILPVTRDPYSSLGAERIQSEEIRWAVDNGADIINMSLGLPRGECRPELAEAVRYAIDHDVPVVASAGNVADGVLRIPGGCPGVLTVGAITASGEAWADTYRADYIDVAAPGVDILVLRQDGTASIGGGTSLAAALVSGVLALLRAQWPEASVDELVTRVIGTAQDIGPGGFDEATGYGLVRPYEALTTNDIPADTPNPVRAALDAWQPPAVPGARASPGSPPPWVVPGPPGANTGSGISPLGIALLAGGAVLVLVLVAATVWAMSSRRRPAADPSDDG